MCDANSMKSVQEDGVWNGVKGRTQIEQDENGKETRIRCQEEIISYFE